MASAFSQDRVTGTGLTFPLKITKIPDKLLKKIFFMTLDLKEEKKALRDRKEMK